MYSVQNEIIDCLDLIRPYAVFGKKKIRIGHMYDGGYVMLDDFSNIKTAISLGIGTDDSWDLVIADLDINVFQYDHTINETPNKHNNCRFKRSKIIQKHNAYSLEAETTLQDILTKNQIEKNSILKMDVEGDEWSILSAIEQKEFDCFDQIVIEFHSLCDIQNEAIRSRYRLVFENITKSHFVFHVHANNCGHLNFIQNIAVPDVLELSLANRKKYEPIENRETFPTKLDSPNNPESIDIILGRFVFR